MVTIDLITLFMVGMMVLLIVLMSIFRGDYKEDREYKILEKKYKKLKKSYLELMDAFEREELRES